MELEKKLFVDIAMCLVSSVFVVNDFSRHGNCEWFPGYLLCYCSKIFGQNSLV